MPDYRPLLSITLGGLLAATAAASDPLPPLPPTLPGQMDDAVRPQNLEWPQRPTINFTTDDREEVPAVTSPQAQPSATTSGPSAPWSSSPMVSKLQYHWWEKVGYPGEYRAP